MGYRSGGKVSTRTPWVRGCIALIVLAVVRVACVGSGRMPGSRLSTRSARSRRRMGLRGGGLPMCTSRSASRRNQTSGMAGPTSRQGRLKASEARMRNHSGSAHGAVAPTEAGRHYAGAPVAGSKTRPSRHIACITTASLRARATAARLKPTFSLSFRPQLRSTLSERTRLSITVAAS